MSAMRKQTEVNANRRLFSNTVFLYIMNFSSQLFNFISVPYLTRVLGPLVYGKIGIALSCMLYVQAVIDFGFILSATRKVSQNRENNSYLSNLLSSVLISKLMLSAVVSVVFLGIIYCSSLSKDMAFYALYLISQVLYACLPDFFYRGIENMKIITYRTVLIKASCTALIFIFVKDASQLMLVPLFTAIGNGLAVITMYYDLSKNYKCQICIPSWRTVWAHFCDSAQFFASRIAGVVYQASNTIILSALYGDSVVTGLYASADKVVALTKSASSPIADSLFPYMVKHKNYRLIRRILMVACPLILVAATVCLIWPCEICAFVFGEAYYDAGKILRLLVPMLVCILPTYILAFPVMVPLGLTKKANLSNVYGLALEAVLLLTFHLTKRLNVYTLCICTSVVEVTVLMYRIICTINQVRKNNKRREASA